MSGGKREPPIPPFELANRVKRLPGARAKWIAEYEELGAQTRSALLGLLPEGASLEGKRLLDFGCGAGRTLRHFLGEAESGEVWGTDIDGPSIEWLQRNLCPPLHATRCEVDPPLPFADGHFDFAWAISLFTHLSGNSADWLLELHRVLRPGGLLMATYMGKYNSEAIAGEEWDEDRVVMNLLFHNRPWDDGGPMVLMSDWWVDEHWGRAFEILARFDLHGQTWTMMRKRDVSLTPEELLEPGPDPREWRALRHNIAQLQREVEMTQRWAARSAAERGLRDRLRPLATRIRGRR